MRHGRPVHDTRRPVSGAAFAGWMAEYHGAPLDASLPAPDAALALARGAGCVVTSTVRRSIDSAVLLAPACPVERDALFDEVAMPVGLRSRIRLRPIFWAITVRVAWAFGWISGSETMAAARERGTRAATRLEELALQHGSVLLMGHGLLNEQIRRALRERGWRGTRRNHDFWGACILRRSA